MTKSFTVGLPVTELKRAVEWCRQLLGEVEELNPAPGVWEFQIVPSGWLQLFESEINKPNQSVCASSLTTSKQVGCLLRASVSMLTKLKLFQKPLDILSSGIHLATDCRFMSCWRNPR